MNSYHFSGWLVEHGVRGFDARGTAKAKFRVNVKAADGSEHMVECHCADQEILTRCGDLLTIGRNVIGRGEIFREPYKKFEVHTRDTLLVRVVELEIPNRSKVEPDESTTKDTKHTKVESGAAA